MRKWCGLFLSGAVAIGFASPSFAETKSFNGTFAISLGSFPPFSFTVTGGTLDATIAGGAVTAFTVPAAVFDIQKLTPVDPPITIATSPAKVLLTAVDFSAKNQAGSFNQTDGEMNAKGGAVLKLKLGTTALTAKIPLTNAIGVTKQVKTTLLGVQPVTLDAKKFTIGKATLTTVPLGGGAEAKVTEEGSFNGTNTFTFVAPTQVTLPMADPDPDGKIASFGILTIEILEVPEAGSALLLATGAAVLLFLGYRRSVA